MALIRQKQFHISRLPPRGLPAPPTDDDAQPVQSPARQHILGGGEEFGSLLGLGDEGTTMFQWNARRK